jgi:hypothetical protein
LAARVCAPTVKVGSAHNGSIAISIELCVWIALTADGIAEETSGAVGLKRIISRKSAIFASSSTNADAVRAAGEAISADIGIIAFISSEGEIGASFIVAGEILAGCGVALAVVLTGVADVVGLASTFRVADESIGAAFSSALAAVGGPIQKQRAGASSIRVAEASVELCAVGAVDGTTCYGGGVGGPSGFLVEAFKGGGGEGDAEAGQKHQKSGETNFHLFFSLCLCVCDVWPFKVFFL